MTRIGIILGSSRANRNGDQVANWLQDVASRRDDAEFELIDLRDYSLPHMEKIASFDGFVMVTPEYNGSSAGVPKNDTESMIATFTALVAMAISNFEARKAVATSREEVAGGRGSA
jgi:hypothetical protein